MLNRLALMVLFLALPGLAFAQATMALSVDAGGSFVQWYDTPVGTSFDVVVWVDTDGETAVAAEFVLTELALAVPGVMKVGTTKVAPVNLEIGDNSVGEYLFHFGDLNDPVCKGPSPQLELVRIENLDATGLIGRDVLLTLRGFGPGDTAPSSFQGAPGFATCSNIGVACRVGGADGGYTQSGTFVPDGSVVLNPTAGFVADGIESMGMQKARF